MSLEENSAETQGVKAYRVNNGYLSNIDEWNFHEITRAMGVDAAWHEVSVDVDTRIVTATDYLCRQCLAKFNPGGIHFEYDDTICKDFAPGSDAFALAITYGIYEEAN